LNTPRIGVIGIALAVPLVVANAQKASACVNVDVASLDERRSIAEIATTTEARFASRRLLYKLPIVADSDVVLVQDPRDCARALRALNRAQNRSRAEGQRAVLVIRVGTVFVVSDPKYRVGEFTAYTVFDSRFTTVLAAVAR